METDRRSKSRRSPAPKSDLVESFRAYCFAGRPRRGRDPFYRVFLFRDRFVMREFIREYCSQQITRPDGVRIRFFPPSHRRARHWKGCLGWCARFAPGASVERDPRQIGVVCFSRDSAGAGIVAHEMTHAALYTVDRGYPPFRISSRDDERLALICGNLVRQFWNWFYRRSCHATKTRQK